MISGLNFQKRVFLGLSSVLIFALLWQYVGPRIRGQAVAALTDSLAAAWRLLSSNGAMDVVPPSLIRILAGFGLSALLGIAFGCLFGSVPSISQWVRPTIDFLRAIPSPIIIPIGMAFLGLGTKLVTGVIVFGSIWPVLINTTDAISRVEPQYLDVARIAGLGKWRTLFQVKLPASLPLIMPGLRLTMALAMVLMVTGEMLGASTGIGYQLVYAQQTFDVAGTYGGILVLAAIGFMLDVALVRLDKRFVRQGSGDSHHGG